MVGRMGNQMSRVPEEIRRFFSVKGNNILLVKGKAGSGKTLFSMEFLLEFAERGYGYYLSTRVDPDVVLSQYPHISEYLPPENIIDAVRTPFPRAHSMYEALEFSSFPDFLRGLYTKIGGTAHVDRSLVVIDSLDAICDAIKVSEIEFMHVFSDFARKSNIKTVIITERMKSSKLDYLADGVVSLTYELINGRMYREMVIEKLRSVKINNPVVAFTLSGGRFEMLTRFKYPSMSEIKEKGKRIVDVLSKMKIPHERCTTGSLSLDRAIGLFRYGNFLFYEIGPYVPVGVLTALTEVHMRGFLSRNIDVIYIPPEYVDKEFPLRQLELIFGKSIYDRVNMMSLDVEDVEMFVRAFITERAKVRSPHVAIMFSIDALEHTFGMEDGVRAGTRILSEGRKMNDIIVAFAHESSKSRKIFRDMADRGIRVFYRHGYVFLYGTRPRTPIYNAYFDPQHEYLDLKLLEIV